MALVKNVRPYSIDAGGRALAPGEGPVDLSLDDPVVAELVDLGHLVVCVLPPTDQAAQPNPPAARSARTTAPADAPAEES